MKPRFSLKKPAVPALIDLYQHARWARGRKAAGVRVMLRHTDLCVCAWKGRLLVAFARVTTDFSYRAVVWDVIVRDGHQGQGLGKAVMTRVLRHPRLRGVEGFWLFTTDKEAFYRKLGFKLFRRSAMAYRTTALKSRR